MFATQGVNEGIEMLRKFARLFMIKNRFEAFLIIFALALGACERGSGYIDQYPGWFGWLMFSACTVAVFMAGAKILDCLEYERAGRNAAQAEPVGPSGAPAR
jgi:hypothetical protein